MSTIRILNGTPIKMRIKLPNLDFGGHEFSEITDVKYLLKENATDEDANAKLTKTLKGDNGIVLDEVREEVIVSILITDYDSLDIDKSYLICFSVEFNSNGEYIEDDDPDLDRMLEVLQDKTRA